MVSRPDIDSARSQLAPELAAGDVAATIAQQEIRPVTEYLPCVLAEAEASSQVDMRRGDG